MYITNSNLPSAAQNPLPPQPVGSQAVRRIERSNITTMDLAKFLQNRTVEEVQDIAKKICTAAIPDPDFKLSILKEQLRDSGFVNIKQSRCEGGEKRQLITGLLKHIQGEFLNLGEGVEGSEATKFCKLIREPNSCLSMGIDCLIDEINVHKREQEAGGHVLPGMSAGLPLSEGFPPGDGGTTGQAMNPDVFQQLPREQQALHYPPVNPAPSAPPAYDVAMAGSRASELPEQQRCNKGLEMFASQLGRYSLDPSGARTAMNNMAQILTRMSGQCTLPKTTTVARGERLTSLAKQVRMTSVNVFRDDFVSTAGIGVSVVGNNRDIQPVVSVSWLTLDKFPAEVQERLQLAGIGDYGKEDTNVPIVQVYLCASSEKALEGAEFTVDLHSTIKRRYLSKFWPRGLDKLIPLSVALRMPKGLQQGAGFHHVGFALHQVSGFGGERPSSSSALFSHGRGHNESERHNIGIQQVAPILEAMGVDRKTAMSSEAGLAIPFGFTLLKQSRDALEREARVSNMLEPRELFDFGSLFGGASSRGGTYRGGTYRGGNFRGGESADVLQSKATGETSRGFSMPTQEDEPEANERITSGINPLACTTESEYTCVKDGVPTEAFAWVGGLIWVQTVTSLPGIETSEDLKQWVDKQKVDPLNPVLPGIL
ncbi:hypothetical protein [Salinisphaera sp. G21_0]|uniref:hypothetical protein n=1 Tax=Salinisphaera sp. G21_0 TaxID=2821094 RepID=UPI001ADC1E3A|nr:hypothetical protein [Salinisphaera sp. G21_0]MBO9484270.1 hypothetical protein [Salinisphaera sp. G21_0]